MRQAQPTAQSTFSSPRCDVSEAVWGPTGTASAHLILIGTRARASPQDRLHQIHFSIFNLKWQTHTHLTAPHALCGAVWTSDGNHVLGWAVVSAGITGGLQGRQRLVQLFTASDGMLVASHTLLPHATASDPSVSPCGRRLVWMDSDDNVTGHLVSVEEGPVPACWQQGTGSPTASVALAQMINAPPASHTGVDRLIPAAQDHAQTAGLACQTFHLQHPDELLPCHFDAALVKWASNGDWILLERTGKVFLHKWYRRGCFTILSSVDASAELVLGAADIWNAAWHPLQPQLAVCMRPCQDDLFSLVPTSDELALQEHFCTYNHCIAVLTAPDWQPVWIAGSGLISWGSSGLLVASQSIYYHTADVNYGRMGPLPLTTAAIWNPAILQLLGTWEAGAEVDGPWVPEEHDRHRGPPRWARCGKVCFIQGEVLGVSLVEPGAAGALVNPALEGRTICTPATQLCPLPELAAPSITSDQAAVHPSKDSADSAEALQDASPRLSAMHAGGPELEADTQDEESIGGSEAPWKFVFGHAAAPSPCGRYLVALKSCYDLMRLGFLVQRPAELQNIPETYRALDAPSWRLVHYDLAAQELHCLLAGLPNPRTRCEEISEFDPFVEAAWQPWPQASLLYAWASAQGPAFLVDCHQHCVLARLSLDGDHPCLRIQPRSQLGTLDGVCYDEELGKLPGSTYDHPGQSPGQGSSTELWWSGDGRALSIQDGSAMGLAVFGDAALSNPGPSEHPRVQAPDAIPGGSPLAWPIHQHILNLAERQRPAHDRL